MSITSAIMNLFKRAKPSPEDERIASAVADELATEVADELRPDIADALAQMGAAFKSELGAEYQSPPRNQKEAAMPTVTKQVHLSRPAMPAKSSTAAAVRSAGISSDAGRAFSKYAETVHDVVYSRRRAEAATSLRALK